MVQIMIYTSNDCHIVTQLCALRWRSATALLIVLQVLLAPKTIQSFITEKTGMRGHSKLYDGERNINVNISFSKKGEYIQWNEIELDTLLRNNFQTTTYIQDWESDPAANVLKLPESNENSSKMSVYNVLLTSENKMRRVGSTSSRKPTKKTISTRRRSSTMPGLNRLTEQSPRSVLRAPGVTQFEAPETRESRRKINGENMYRNSPAVPESMVQFADLIHKQDRITHKEEKELGSKTQEAIRLQNLYDSLVIKLNRDPTDDEWCAEAGKINMEAIRQAIDEGIEAKNKLVTSNLRMVQSVVNTYIRNGLSAHYNAGDMMQEGIVALIRAAEKFEPERGWKFSTYAMYWVRASVKRSQITQSRIITVPQRSYENHKRLLRVERDILLSTGKRPTHKELGELVGMSEQQVDRCFTAMRQRCYSLDQHIINSRKPMNAASGRDTLIDIIESNAVCHDKDFRSRENLRLELIESLRRHLSEQEVEILLLRFGLVDLSAGSRRNETAHPPLVTIAELSNRVGLKPDKVRRILNNSLKHLQTVGLEEYLAFEQELQ
jgi:RNA polymerase sigma factor (sigma-70 family)